MSNTQAWSAVSYDRNARFVSELGAEILSWLDVKPGEDVLDLGCGDGALTLKIAETGANVIGVDASAQMLEAACELGLDARSMNGHALEFDNQFDAVFSNAALHWMLEPEKVICGVHQALRPGGRFVAEFGGFGNVAAIDSTLRGVGLARLGESLTEVAEHFFPTPDHYQTLLEDNGFTVQRIELYPRPTPLPTGIEGWLETFRTPFFEQFPAAERPHILELVKAALKPALCDEKGGWWADYVRLRLAARRSDT